MKRVEIPGVAVQEAILVIESSDYPLTFQKVIRAVEKMDCHIDFVIGVHPSGYRRVRYPFVDFGSGPAVWSESMLKKSIRIMNRLTKQGHLPVR